MEILIIAFLALTGVGVATSVKEDSNKQYTEKQTRLIKQTRQTVYETNIVQDWE
jgi:hypothetical protein